MAGVRFSYAYHLPTVLENFWMQEREEFARPELLIDWIELEGPVHSVWPPESHSRILFNSLEKSERAYARGVLRRFMFRAYRRPLRTNEMEPNLALFANVRHDRS